MICAATSRTKPRGAPTGRRGARLAAVGIVATALLATGSIAAEPDLPLGVFAAADSVLRAVSFGAPTGKPRNVATNRIAAIDPTGLAPPFDRQTRTRIQAAFCRANGLERCPIFDREVQGTAFVLARADEIVTCRHLVHDWLHWASVLNGGIAPARLVPPIFLTDRSRTTTVSTWRTGYHPLLFVDDRALAAPLARLVDADAFWDADILAFRLISDALPPPLPRGAPPLLGETTHAIGYADGSDGVHLHAVAGRVLRSEGIEIETDADTRRGMSGAPLVDAEGRARAISCGRERGGGASAGALALPLDVDLWAPELHRRRGMVPLVDPDMR